ncbi:MAG: DUF3095 domain-containing protein [Hyphomicrobiaceae bacterium]
MPSETSSGFYAGLTPFTSFSDVLDPSNYRPLPDDWLVGTADVVDSTGAIQSGRYKAVNMVGASVISAARNVTGDLAFPFVFGGDGASLAIPGDTADALRECMARLQTWARKEMALTLRAALIPVSEIRRSGADVTVARFQASPDASYAMFAGGGLAWAERQMKSGRYGVPPAAHDEPPDLEGLSCRWQPIPARRGAIVSLIVTPQRSAGDPDFRGILGEVLALLAASGRDGHPVPPDGPGFRWPAPGSNLEVKASRGRVPTVRQRRRIALQTFVTLILDRTGLKLGSFDLRHYKQTLARNTDFRKFDDGLKLTVDCSDATATDIERRLDAGFRKGALFYGLYRQAEAQMTCIVPSYKTDDHIHFVDGALGGYAKAAERMKAQMAAMPGLDPTRR